MGRHAKPKHTIKLRYVGSPTWLKFDSEAILGLNPQDHKAGGQVGESPNYPGLLPSSYVPAQFSVTGPVKYRDSKSCDEIEIRGTLTHGFYQWDLSFLG